MVIMHYTFYIIYYLKSFYRFVRFLLLGCGAVHHTGLATRGGCAHVGFVDGFTQQLSLQGVARGEIVDAVGVHQSCISPVGAGRGGATSDGEDVPHRHAMAAAEIDDAASYIGSVLIRHLGGAVVCTTMTSCAGGIASCALGDETARRCSEEEAHTWTPFADTVGEGLHGLSMCPFVDGVAMCLIGAKGHNDQVWTFSRHTVNHILLIESACPSTIHTIIGELHPREIPLQRASQGTRQDVTLHMRVAYLHHLDGLVLVYLLEHRSQGLPINEFVGAGVAEGGRERCGQ